MFDLLRPYITIARLWIGMTILISAGGYIAYLNHRAHELEGELAFMKQTVETCTRQRSRLQAVAQVQAQNITLLTRYYARRKCLDLRPGELADRELSVE
jgi:hypothetical protein